MDVAFTSEEAQAAVVQYERMVWFIANRLHRRFDSVSIDKDDLASEVRLGFLEAARNYRNRRVPFGLYARKAGLRRGYAYCRSCISRWFGLTRKQKRDLAFRVRHMVSIEENGLRNDLSQRRVNEPTTLALLEAELSRRLSLLSPQKQQVIELRFRDCLSQNDIAAVMNLTQARVWVLIRDALIDLREARPSKVAKRLKPDQVAMAIQWRAEGLPISEIGKRLGITDGQASRVSRGRTCRSREG